MLKEFSYLAPKNKTQLLKLLAEHTGKPGVGKTAKILAGGTDILVNIRNGFDKTDLLIDIKKIGEYSKLDFNKTKGLLIGANVTYIQLINNKNVKKHYPVLIETAGKVGSPQLRNRGTIIGNICTASPAADMSRSLLCLGAEVNIVSIKGSRSMKLKDFFKGVKKTALKAGEIVESITIPIDMADAKYGDEKLKRIKGHDLAQAAVSIVKKDKVLRVAISSCAIVPVLLKDFKSNVSSATVCKEALKSISPIDDIRASKDYRIHMVKTYIKRIMDKI
ncbi:FAD binding domain-containing protein [bacterium]|nr:FAD binding domain-containing protein [bacterium]